MESLSKIGSILGIPLKTDRYTKDKQVIRYARLLVEIQIDGPFPEHIEFFNEEGILLRQLVTYEWIQTKCTHCAMLDHSEKRKVQNSNAPTQPASSPQRDQPPSSAQAPHPSETSSPSRGPLRNAGTTQEEVADSFTKVSKGSSPRRAIASLSSPSTAVPHSNRFNVLLNDHILGAPLEEMNNIGLIGLLETKIKRQKENIIANNMFRG
ncbi:hypothetical protein Cgig2_007148 [Carnegiea gigantea]|uniref:Uncharacterized protein n=1 Tax=Carnegiea gigantea TaxID=171969 RepID=A0A9Q1KLW6_9CARY|nr:hypothetical protein Cgig2_007148 [Carnegiea gigantea]